MSNPCCEWFKRDRDTQLARIKGFEVDYDAKIANVVHQYNLRIDTNDKKNKEKLASRDAKCVALIERTNQRNRDVYAQSGMIRQECTDRVASISRELSSTK